MTEAVAAAVVTDRAALARAVLQRAEQRTGARSPVWPVVGRTSGTAVARPEGSAGAGRPGHGAGSRAAERTPHVHLGTREPPLSTPVALAPLLPDGLRRGTATVVQGSASLLLGLVAAACADGGWAAVVGHPALGVLAAAQAGVALDRLALVPEPGPQAPAVLAALVDGLDLVVVGPRVTLLDSDRSRLLARARERGAVLLATAWPGAATVLTVESAAWSGPGQGEGRLRRQRVRVWRSGRGTAAAGLGLEVELPLALPGATERPLAVPDAADTPLRLVG